jgi:hypothetical protein
MARGQSGTLPASEPARGYPGQRVSSKPDGEVGSSGSASGAADLTFTTQTASAGGWGLPGQSICRQETSRTGQLHSAVPDAGAAKCADFGEV